MRKKPSNSQLIAIVTFVIGWLTAPYLLGQEKPSIAKMTWQQSTEDIVKLSVRNKYGWLKSYSVIFKVKQPDGKEVIAEKQGRDDKWVYVYFPEDFQTYTKPGNYSWRAIVDTTQIINGEFNYAKPKKR